MRYVFKRWSSLDRGPPSFFWTLGHSRHTVAEGNREQTFQENWVVQAPCFTPLPIAIRPKYLCTLGTSLSLMSRRGRLLYDSKLFPSANGKK